MENNDGWEFIGDFLCKTKSSGNKNNYGVSVKYIDGKAFFRVNGAGVGILASPFTEDGITYTAESSGMWIAIPESLFPICEGWEYIGDVFRITGNVGSGVENIPLFVKSTESQKFLSVKYEGSLRAIGLLKQKEYVVGKLCNAKACGLCIIIPDSIIENLK